MCTCPFCTAAKPNESSVCPRCRRTVNAVKTADDDGRVAFHLFEMDASDMGSGETLADMTLRISLDVLKDEGPDPGAGPVADGPNRPTG